MSSSPSVDDVPLVSHRLRLAAMSRFAIVGTLTVATLVAFRDSPQAPTPRILILTGVIVLTASLISLLPFRDRRTVTLLGALQLAGDVLLATVAVYLTGGAESAFSILFHLAVIVAAFFFGQRGAYLIALASAVCFTTTALLLHSTIISEPADLLANPTPQGRELAYYLGSNLLGLGIVAALAGYLAERERLTGGKLAEAQKLSADLAALNEDIVRSLTVGLAALDKHGELLWMNPAGHKILGLRDSSMSTETLSQLVNLDAPPTNSGVLDERVITRRDGSKITLSFRIAPLLDGIGATRGSLVVFQDITELRRMQAKIEHAERLAALGKLSAGLAHELRNPIGSISGSLELIREGSDLGEEERRLVGVILDELDRLTNLVTEMVDLARPRQPHPIPLDLVSMIRDVADAVRLSAEAEDVELDLALPENANLTADPDQMRQLIWNLLRNGVQASPPHSTLRVRLTSREEALLLEVEDSGDGIAEADRERVFEPFFSTKRSGLGMGLALCKQVVAAHGGSIAIAHAEPKGSLFTVTLPITQGGKTQIDVDDEPNGHSQLDISNDDER